MSRTYGTVGRTPHGWVVRAEPHILLRMKRVFSRVNQSAHGALALSHTAENCRDLEWFCERYPMEFLGDCEHQLRWSAAGHRESIDRLEEILGEAYTPRAFELAVPARRYQATAAELALHQEHLLLADDVGLGKTASAICMLSDPATRPAAVVTKTILPPQWLAELNRFAPSLSVHILKKATPYKLPLVAGRGPDVVVMNYAKMAGWADVLAPYARTVVFDEVQELRHRGTGKYAAALHLARAAAFRLGLSATPIYNYGGEIFNVLDLLREGSLGTWEEFTREWCQPMMNGQQRIRDPRAFGTYLRESGLMLRRTREQVGRELPEVTRVPHHIGADTKALDHVEDSVAELARTILDRNASKQDRFEASGRLDVVMRQATGIAKAPFVADFVRMLVESGERVVLCGWHREVYSIWESKLRDLSPVFITGAESYAQKLAAKAAFIAGESPVLVLSLRSGEGIDGLQGVCRVMVFGELDWAEGVHEQCIGRIHRDGQGHPVTAYFLVSKVGADPIMAEVLGVKRNQLEGIRSPDRDLIERLDTGGAHARRLAEAYLAKRGLLRV